MTTSPQGYRIVGRFLLLGALVMFTAAAAVHWQVFPIDNVRTISLAALSIFVMAVSDSALGLYYLTRS